MSHEQDFRFSNRVDYQKVVGAIPDPYLVLSAEFNVLLASNSYLKATHTECSHLYDRPIFDIFLDNTHRGDENTLVNLRMSLQAALETKQPHEVPVRPYSIINAEGKIENKYWIATNTPALDENGEVLYIIHKVTDVTKEYLAKEALKRSEKKLNEKAKQLKAAKAAGRIGSFERHFPSNKIFWSDELYRIHDLEPQSEEITYNRFLSFIHPDDVEETRKAILQLYTSSLPIDIIHRIISAKGREKYVHRRVELIRNSFGQPVKITGTVQDLTNLIEVEEVLKGSRELLEATLDSSFDIIQVFEAVRDEKGNIVDFVWILNNLRAEQILGNVLGEKLLERNPRMVEAGIFEKFKDVVETGSPQQYEVPRLFSNNQGYYYQSVVKLGDGVATTTSDITARKDAERELEENKKLLQSIFDSSPTALTVYKAITDEGEIIDFEILMANTYTEKIRGLSSEQLIGKRIGQVFPTAIKNGVFEKFKHAATAGDIVDFEKLYEGEGMKYWLRFIVRKVGDLLVAITENITERKKAENTIQQMLNGSIAAIFLIDCLRDKNYKIIDFVYKAINKASEAIFRNSAENVLGKRMLDLFPLTEELTFEDYVRVVETGKSCRVVFHYPYVGYDNWFDLTAVKNGDGLIITVLDITEQKKAELALKESKELVESITLITPDLITIFDAEQRKIIYSNTANFWFGNDFDINILSEREDVIINKMVAADSRDDISRFLQERLLLKDQDILEIEVKTQNASKDWSWIKIRSKVFKRDQEGKPLQIISFMTNITRRKNAELESAKTKELMQTVLQKTPSSIMMLKPLRNEHNKIKDFEYIFINETALRSVNRNDLVGKRFGEEFPETLSTELFYKYIEVVESGQDWSSEVHIDHSGLDVWSLVYASRVNEDQLLVTYIDITERKKAELERVKG